jgi:hypothetical protein
MFCLVRKLINAAHFCNRGSLVLEGQEYVIHIQTGAELMRCYSFRFSIYQFFCSKFCTSSCLWFSITLLSKSNASDVIYYCYTCLVASKEIKNIAVVHSFMNYSFVLFINRIVI